MSTNPQTVFYYYCYYTLCNCHQCIIYLRMHGCVPPCLINYILLRITIHKWSYSFSSLPTRCTNNQCAVSFSNQYHTCITTLHIRCSDCPRSSHPYFHNETSCSTVASNWWCSWAITLRPHYNTTKPIAHSTRPPRLLS